MSSLVNSVANTLGAYGSKNLPQFDVGALAYGGKKKKNIPATINTVISPASLITEFTKTVRRVPILTATPSSGYSSAGD